MTAKRALLDRDQQLLNRLALIEHKVDSLEQTTAFALRAEATKHRASVKEIFKKGKRRAQIYLAVDGIKGVTEVAAHLGMKRQNVGPELKRLEEEGLLEVVAIEDGKSIWAKKSIDRTLRVSRFLQDEYSLTADGRDASPRGKR